MKNAGKIFMVTGVIVYAVLLIVFFKETAAGVASAVNICLTVMIPSLYAFMVISGFFISSGMYRLLSKPFGFVSRYIFRLPEELFSVFIVSCFAGYPTGAKMLGELYLSDCIDKKTAERMLGFCCMGGPAFFCGTAGIQIYGSVKIGIIIFLCILASNSILAIASGIGSSLPSKNSRPIDFTPSREDFILSVYSGGISMLKICGMIIFSSTFISIADGSGILSKAAAILSSVLKCDAGTILNVIRSLIEISFIRNMPNDIACLPIVTALLAFGGICVVFQVTGFIPKELSTKNFFHCRIYVSILSYFCCKILICLVDLNSILPVMAVRANHRQNSPIPSVFLLIMTILLLSNNFIEKSKKI